MPDLTPEKRALTPECRAMFRKQAENARPFVRHGGTDPAVAVVSAADLLALLDAADERDRLAAQVGRVRELHDDRAWECANPQHTNPSVGCPECRESCMSCGEDYPCATLRALDADA